ncbi:MAG: peptidoglycan-binding protein [Clostridia bacterium]|nr:peptidoglycan-binding protein [Clostridia bacterium]
MKRSLLALLAVLLFLLPLGAIGEEEAVPVDDLDDDGFEITVTEDRDLKEGDEGDDVSTLQYRLKDLYYLTSEATGVYDAATTAAIKSFQEDFSLEVTGEADAKTQSLLFAAQYRPLKKGCIGDDVKELQTRLTVLGYYKGKVSGEYLDATEEAVRAYQEANGEEVTGIADVDTLAVLLQASEESSDTADTGTVMQGTVAYTERLAKGSTGTLVKQLQTRLTELGYYSGPISGNFLGKTMTAVKALQKQNGVTVDGIVGEVTWNLIFNDASVVLPDATPKPTPTPTPVPYAITVDVANQVTTVYGLDENGEHTVIVRQMLCSTGTKSNPSDPGDWVLTGRKAKWCYFPKWGGHARYWTRINSSIAFHSVIYNAVDTKALAKSSYNNLGKRVSHGCIRLTVADAKWIYDNCGEGTVVSIVEDMPADPELRASLKLPALNTKTMLPEETPEPTASPTYVSDGLPPMPLAQLKKNDSSEAVYWMQMKLTELGYYHGKCSGTYLDGTVQAVKDFQKAAGLKVTGTATVATLEALYADVLTTPTIEPTPTLAPTPTPVASLPTPGSGE